jgi:addiction module HigA family antidote
MSCAWLRQDEVDTETPGRRSESVRLPKKGGTDVDQHYQSASVERDCADCGVWVRSTFASADAARDLVQRLDAVGTTAIAAKDPRESGVFEAARQLEISPDRLNEIVLGKRGITADTALRLARLLKNSPQFWMRLQADWDFQAIARAAKAS